MTPPYMHMHLLSIVRQGLPPASTGDPPGVQLPAVEGTQGWGVSTPMAAAVAEATCGLAMLVHIPKLGMFKIPVPSAMVPIGFPSANVDMLFVALKDAGPVPKEQVSDAPVTTICDIFFPYAERQWREARGI